MHDIYFRHDTVEWFHIEVNRYYIILNTCIQFLKKKNILKTFQLYTDQ